MTVYEYGTENKQTILLIHPSVVLWDYYEYVIPLLQDDFHVVIPALPGYDKKKPEQDFTSMEEIASEIANWLEAKGILEVACVYGCSMGGGIVLRMVADNRIRFQHVVADGGITPYQLPWLVTRLLAVRDFVMISMGKFGGLKLLEKAFATDEYSEEDLKYEADVLHFISYKTIWRTFESCNNYAMPKEIANAGENLEYWYADKEKKERALDIKFVKANFPKTRFVELEGIGHAGLATKEPQKMADMLRKLCKQSGSVAAVSYEGKGGTSHGRI